MMTRTARFGSRWFGSVGKQLAVLAVPAALLIGCSDGDGGNRTVLPTATVAAATRTATPVATATSPPTATPTMSNATASAACQKLVGCGQCFLNQRGVCIGTDDCAGRLTAEVAGCINAVAGCDQQAMGTCLPFGCQGTGTGLCDMTAG